MAEMNIQARILASLSSADNASPPPRIITRAGSAAFTSPQSGSLTSKAEEVLRETPLEEESPNVPVGRGRSRARANKGRGRGRGGRGGRGKTRGGGGGGGDDEDKAKGAGSVFHFPLYCILS